MLKLICVLLLISTCESARDASSILSRLFKKSNRNATPLILVLDRSMPLNGLSKNSHTYDRGSYSSYADSSEEGHNHLQHILNQLTQLQSGQKSHATSHHHHKAVSHSLLHDKYQDRHQNRHDRHVVKRKDRLQDLESRPDASRLDRPGSKVSVLRSPVYKSLLTLRNRFHCEARNECKNECGYGYRGSQKDSCEVECEEKFECEEPKSECEDSGDCNDSENDCLGDDCFASTKGVTISTERPPCTRC